MADLSIPRGHWKEILVGFGIDSAALTGHQCPCPVCGGTDRFRFDNKEERGTWYCNRCGAGDGYKLLMATRELEFKDVVQQVESFCLSLPPPPKRKPRPRDPAKFLTEIWTEAIPAHPQIVGYFRMRQIPLPADWSSPVLRFHPFAPAPQGVQTSAILARVYNPGHVPAGLHRIFLPGPLAPARRKMLLPTVHTLRGCYIPIKPMTDGVLGLAEGIETAVSVHALSDCTLPVWSAVSANQLEHFVPPDGTKRLLIFADNDVSFVGQAKAYTLASRLKNERPAIQCQVLLPPRHDSERSVDWNDVMTQPHHWREQWNI